MAPFWASVQCLFGVCLGLICHLDWPFRPVASCESTTHLAILYCRLDEKPSFRRPWGILGISNIYIILSWDWILILGFSILNLRFSFVIGYHSRLVAGGAKGRALQRPWSVVDPFLSFRTFPPGDGSRSVCPGEGVSENADCHIYLYHTLPTHNITTEFLHSCH